MKQNMARSSVGSIGGLPALANIPLTPANDVASTASLASFGTRDFRLLVYARYSTDFEVHRNWLAVTYSQSPTNWYYESTSQWTLDYPPFFAWMELLLSHIAASIDPKMVEITKLGYASPATVIFQRASVICLDFVFMFAVNGYIRTCFKSTSKSSASYTSPSFTVLVLLLANFGLLLVDHIHFQYNGFLFGLLLISFNKFAKGRALEGAMWFAVLLNFKHIFLYVAPAFFIYLLKTYCFSTNKDGSVRWFSFSPVKFLGLALNVSTVFLISFGPFIAKGQLRQVLSRLFPFKRGLCHAYWAPNFWAIYNLLDKGAAFIGTKSGVMKPTQNASMTAGLVQEYQHAVLPPISPFVTVACTLFTLLPCLYHLWHRGRDLESLIRAVILCAFSSFLFAWHVHEKAILIISIPFALLSCHSASDSRLFLILSTTGHLSLFPLIYTTPELPIKYLLMLLYTAFSFRQLSASQQSTTDKRPVLHTVISHIETLYLLGLIPLQLYCDFGHSMLSLHQTLPFLPLMFTSVYCAVGIIYVWVRFYVNFLNIQTFTGIVQKID